MTEHGIVKIRISRISNEEHDVIGGIERQEKGKAHDKSPC